MVAPTAPTPTGPLICFIGEDRNFAGILERRLGEHGLRCIAAADAPSGVRLAQHYQPRVLLLDERIGRHESLSVAATLRRVFPKGAAGIIWHAAGITRDKVLAAHKAGVDTILARPLTFGTLAARINTFLDPASSVAVETLGEGPSATEEETRRRLGRIQSLNAVPYVVERVLSITGDDASNAKDLEQVIESDPQVAAVILKRANSAFYGAIRRISRILDSIARIGFSEVRAIVLGLSVIELFPKEQKNLGFDRIEFWRSCLATAVIAQMLAKDAGCDPDEAFMAGLLHDLGRVILDEHFPDDFSRAVALSERMRIPLVEAEERVFGMSHEGVGAEILERWQFPPALVAVVGRHESPGRLASIADPKVRAVAETVWVADWLVRTLDIGSSGDRFVSFPDPLLVSEFAAWKGLPKDFEEKARERIRDLMSFLGAELPDRPRTSSGATALLYEESRYPWSPMGSLLDHAGLAIRPAASPAELSSPEPRTLVVAEFATFANLKAALPRLSVERAPHLLLVPRGELPGDSRIKTRVGIPTTNTVYLETPFHKAELVDALGRLLPLMDEPGRRGPAFIVEE